MTFLSDPIAFLAAWFSDLFLGWGWSEGFTHLVVTFLGVFLVANFGMLFVIFLIWLERKLAARMQDRLGPNRVGPYGLFQTIADIIKLFTKEDTTPEGSDRVIFNLAPVLAVVSVLLIWAVVPFAEGWIGTDLNVGVLYIVAVGSFGIVATLIAGWSSNNKFALLGAFRTVAQLVSYEVPMILSLLVPVLLARSMGLGSIVEAQTNWYSIFFFMAPIAAIIFFISSIAEIGRTPFDLLEAESEIVAGFHIEYSGAKFAMIFAAEFLHAFTISALTATLFFGGWWGPFAEQSQVLGSIYFIGKSFLLYFVVVWIRSTLPRLRIDHMLSFNWKFLTPFALATVVVTAIVDKLLPHADTFVAQLARAGGLFLVNVGLVLAAVAVLRAVGRRARMAAEGAPAAVAEPTGHGVASPAH